jgi:nucleotide-binding universal stress UspA family protein
LQLDMDHASMPTGRPFDFDQSCAAPPHAPFLPTEPIKAEAMKILLPVDGSDYTKRMLAYLGAHDDLLGPDHEYIVFTAVAQIPPHAARFLDKALLEGYYQEQADEVLAPIKAYAAQNGWKIRALHAPGPAAQAIAGLADSEHAGLIVMGTHGHSALGSVLLGSVASGVLARCKVPVLLVR